MKDEIMACAQTLAELLKASEEYNLYMEAKRKMQADTGAIGIIQDLRQRQMALHLAEMMGTETEDSSKELEDIYLSLSLNPTIGEYLTAEYRFGKVLRRIKGVLAELLEQQEQEIFPVESGEYLN